MNEYSNTTLDNLDPEVMRLWTAYPSVVRE